MFRDELEQMKAEIKESIQSKYELDRGRSGALDERILENEVEKQLLFEDPDIYDLLEAYATSLPRWEHEKGEQVMREEFEDILREMTMEAEGIVA